MGAVPAMNCPSCGNVCLPGSIDGFRYESICRVCAKPVETASRPSLTPVQAQKTVKAVEVPPVLEKPQRRAVFILPYPPTLNHLYATVNGRRVLSKAGRDYHDVVERECFHLNRFNEGYVSVTVHAYRPQRRGDLDGIFKVLLDSLTGVVWKDDSQVVELHAFRHEDKNHPRVTVTVEEV